jgi:hypothetical protein
MALLQRDAWEKLVASWNELIRSVQQLPPHVDLSIKRAQVEEPRHFGFRKSVGWKKGSLRNWRLALPNGRCIHVREYRDHFKIHWDIADPRKNPFKHLVYDTRRLYNSIKIMFVFTTTAIFMYHPEAVQFLLNTLIKGFIIP